MRFPNGESLQDLAVRAANTLRLVLQRHPGDTVVLVSHDSLNGALLLHVLDLPMSAYQRIVQSPCCIDEIDIADGTVRVHRLNETAHVDGISG